MIFKPYNCDFQLKYNSVIYDFDHVDSMVIEDPETVKLVRGANAKNKVGLVYSEGIKDPKKVTVTLLGVSMELAELFVEIYEAKARCELSCIDRTDGSSSMVKDAILSQQPRQLTIDETRESMNVSLVFESFNVFEVHKS